MVILLLDLAILGHRDYVVGVGQTFDLLLTVVQFSPLILTSLSAPIINGFR